jgi:hypothetical protein
MVLPSRIADYCLFAERRSKEGEQSADVHQVSWKLAERGWSLTAHTAE